MARRPAVRRVGGRCWTRTSDPRHVRPDGCPTFASFIEREYWPAVRGALSAPWRERTEGVLASLAGAFALRELDRIEPREVAQWWGHAQERWAPRTANIYLIRLRQVFKLAEEWYHVADPTRGLPKAREPRTHAQYFTADQREALLAHANARLYPYLLWGLYTGARRRSLTELRWPDVNGETVTFRATKTGEDHTVPLHPVLREWCRRHQSETPIPDFVLPRYADGAAISRAFKRLCARLGLPAWARFHSLRHDVGSRLGMAGVNQSAIMAILGHRDPRMSARYTHLSPDAVRKVVETSL